jgi:hypothetical protein
MQVSSVPSDMGILVLLRGFAAVLMYSGMTEGGGSLSPVFGVEEGRRSGCSVSWRSRGTRSLFVVCVEGVETVKIV